MQPKVLANVSEECDCNEKDDNVLAKEKKNHIGTVRDISSH